MTTDIPTKIANLILGEAASMKRLRSLIAKVAPFDLPVLVEGPTGSGKELVAQALHLASGRTGKLESLNVCAISESLFESELFGYSKGAFTGATSDKPGYLTTANGGTLFLDEISSLALASQAKLLRAIETQVFRPAGATSDRRSNFRVVSATNEPISALVQSGRVRRDFAQRLGGIVLRIPSLSERAQDIPLLAQSFIRTASNRNGPVRLTECALRAIQSYSWPGNVRDLKHVVQRAVLIADGSTITAHEILASIAQGVEALHDHVPRNGERRRLLDVLIQHEGNTSTAASELRINRVTVYRRCERLGISLTEVRDLTRTNSRMLD